MASGFLRDPVSLGLVQVVGQRERGIALAAKHVGAGPDAAGVLDLGSPGATVCSVLDSTSNAPRAVAILLDDDHLGGAGAAERQGHFSASPRPDRRDTRRSPGDTS